jgi:hypothetical protein
VRIGGRLPLRGQMMPSVEAIAGLRHATADADHKSGVDAGPCQADAKRFLLGFIRLCRVVLPLPGA